MGLWLRGLGVEGQSRTLGFQWRAQVAEAEACGGAPV